MSFITPEQLRDLPHMSKSEVDALPFGVVRTDDGGTVQLYNKYESELANVAQADAIGKNFFRELAPCTNNRLVFEDNWYKNLFIAFGGEVRYHTPFKAANYSPFTGQFFYQDTTIINNRPEVNLFLNFRIKSFNAFIRMENVQSLTIANGNVGFHSENNYVPHYYYPGLWLRLGILWRFVN